MLNWKVAPKVLNIKHFLDTIIIKSEKNTKSSFNDNSNKLILARFLPSLENNKSTELENFFLYGHKFSFLEFLEK